MTEYKNHSDITSPKRTANTVRYLGAEALLPEETPETDPHNNITIRELHVHGLLSFGEETVFEFGRLNILVGPNGSGKSNLIDCVRVFRNSPFDIQETFKDAGFEEWLYRGLDRQSGRASLTATVQVPSIPGWLRHEISLDSPLNSRAQVGESIYGGSDSDEKLSLHFVGSFRFGATLGMHGVGNRHKERKLSPNEYDPYRSILSQIRDMGQYPVITRLSSMYANFRIYSEWSFGRNSVLREAASTSRSDTTLSESMNDLALALNGLEKTSAHEAIRVLLQDLKPSYRDYATRVIFGRVGLELIEAPFESAIPAKRLSDGTLRFLALAAILLQSNPPPLICLEEPELGMHPDMIRMVAKMIIDASVKTQLIVTTHSEHLLSALQDDFDALFAFDTGLEGSFIRRFSQEEYHTWRDDHTLGELWTSGELGGNRW